MGRISRSYTRVSDTIPSLSTFRTDLFDTQASAIPLATAATQTAATYS